MTSRPSDTYFTEHKVVRRGLIAGIAGLGAAMALKVTGRAEAANNDPLLLGSGANTATSSTQITQTSSGFQVVKDGGVLIGSCAISGSNGSTGFSETGVAGEAVGSGNAGVYGINGSAGGIGTTGDGGVGANAI